MVHLAAPIAATGRAAAQSPPDYFLRPARRAALGVNATPNGSAERPTAPVPAGRPLVSPTPDDRSDIGPIRTPHI
jgi:hypothetical protein